MTPIVETERRFVTETLNKLPMVVWDRFVHDPETITAYGWISRDGEARKDFILIQFQRDEFAGNCEPWPLYWTSSAKHSVEITRILYGDEYAESHIDCERVEDSFPGVKSKVELKKVDHGRDS